MLLWLDSACNTLGGLSGLPKDYIKQLFCLIASYPLSYPLMSVFLPEPNQQGRDQADIQVKRMSWIYIIAVSTFFFLGVFDIPMGLSILALEGIGVYYYVYYFRGRKFMPWSVLVILMTLMLLSHLNRQQVNTPDVFDVTGPQMILLGKLTSFAWNVYDSTRKPDLLSPRQKERAIYKYPCLLEYMAFVFYFPSLIVGPIIEFYDFAHDSGSIVLHQQEQEQEQKDLKSSQQNKNNKPHHHDDIKPVTSEVLRKRCHKVALTNLLQALLFFASYVALGMFFRLSELEDKTFIKSHSFLYRFIYLYVLGFVYRCLYYGAWRMAEGAVIMSGMGYSGLNKVTNDLEFKRIKLIDFEGCELATSLSQIASNWNIATNKWLKYYVYVRTVPSGSKPTPFSNIMTYTISAMWHGTRPGYFLTFLTFAVAQLVTLSYTKNTKKTNNKEKKKNDFATSVSQSISKKGSATDSVENPGNSLKIEEYGVNKLSAYIKTFVSWCLAQAVLAYAVAPFLALDLKRSIDIWADFHFCFHYALLIAILGLFVPRFWRCKCQ